MLWSRLPPPFPPVHKLLCTEPKGMKILQTIALLITGLAFVGVIYYLGQMQIRFSAVDNCLTAGKAQFVRDGQTLSGPDGYWFQFCM